MHKIVIALLILAVLAPCGGRAQVPRLDHAPIVIKSDADFLPINGVVGGLGTPDNPYVISGWNIRPKAPIGLGQGSAINGIYIGGVTKAFVIRDITIDPAIPYAIWIEHAQQAGLEALSLQDHPIAIYVNDTASIMLSGVNLDNTYNGMRIQGGEFTGSHLRIAHSISPFDVRVSATARLDDLTFAGRPLNAGAGVRAKSISMDHVEGGPLAWVYAEATEGTAIDHLNGSLLDVRSSGRVAITNTTLSGELYTERGDVVVRNVTAQGGIRLTKVSTADVGPAVALNVDQEGGSAYFHDIRFLPGNDSGFGSGDADSIRVERVTPIVNSKFCGGVRNVTTVYLSGIQCIHPQTRGLDLWCTPYAGGSMTLRDVTVTGASWEGATIGACPTTLDHYTSIGNAKAMIAYGPLHVKASTFQDDGYGIDFRVGSLQVDGTTFTNETGCAIGAAWLTHSYIKDTMFTGGGCGVFFRNTNETVVAGNVFSNLSAPAITFVGGHGHVVANNTIRAHDQPAILAMGAKGFPLTGLLVDHNAIGNGRPALAASGTGIVVRNNVLLPPDGPGVIVEHGTNITADVPIREGRDGFSVYDLAYGGTLSPDWKSWGPPSPKTTANPASSSPTATTKPSPPFGVAMTFVAVGVALAAGRPRQRRL